MPYLSQVAKGETGLAVKFNLISIIFLTPSLYFFIDSYGLVAAVVIWFIYNIISFIVVPYLALRKNSNISIKEWYIFNILIPLMFMLIAACIVRWLFFMEMSKFETIAFLLFNYISILIISIFTSRTLKNYSYLGIKKLYTKIYG